MADLIHPDAQDPAAEFRGFLNVLVREARHHPNRPVDDDELAAALDAKAADLRDQMGGG